MNVFKNWSVLMMVLTLTTLGCKDAQKTNSQAAQADQKSAKKRIKPLLTGNAPAVGQTPAIELPPDTAVYPMQLMRPKAANLVAPERFTVRLKTTRGMIRMEVNKGWSPKGADRFYNLVKYGFYKNVAFFRVIGGFMAQAGLHGDPRMNRMWRGARIGDDPVKASNTRGAVSFAMSGPNSRTTQFFINFGDNSRLDGMGFAPFAMVDEDSMKLVDTIYAGYGEGKPRGRGPNQGLIHSDGNRYLQQEFPKLDYILDAEVLEE